MDVRQSLRFKVGAFNRSRRDAAAIVNQVARRSGTVSKEQFLDAHSRFEVARKRIIDDTNKVFHSAVFLGVPTSEVRKQFRSGSVSREALEEIVTGIPQTHTWASNAIHSATSPSATRAERKRLKEQLSWLGISPSRARSLLAREYKWRTLKKHLRRPLSGFPTSRAFAERRQRLLRVYR